MRRVVMALALAAVLGITTAPIAFADRPTPVDVGFEQDLIGLCVGKFAPAAGRFLMRLERSSTDIQLSDAATVRVTPSFTPVSEIGSVGLITPGNGELTLPADWTSQPDGTLSEDSIPYDVSLEGDTLGDVPEQPVTWEVEEVGAEPPLVQEFEGSVDGFEIGECAPYPPAFTPTIAPTDSVSPPAGGSDQSGTAMVVVALSGIALTVALARRRLEDKSDTSR
jgi:hypothetical protein